MERPRSGEGRRSRGIYTCGPAVETGWCAGEGDTAEVKRERKYGDKKKGRSAIAGASGRREEDRAEGWSESHDRHLCSPRLHLTLYEPMKWLNHFTTDVYNAIDPYLFITPVFCLHSPLPSSSHGGKQLSSSVSRAYISRENKFNMDRGGYFVPPTRARYGKFHLRSHGRG